MNYGKKKKNERNVKTKQRNNARNLCIVYLD